MRKKSLLSMVLVFGLGLSMLSGCGSAAKATTATSAAATTAAAAVTTAAAADTTAAAGKKFKIGFALKTQDSPYFVALAESIDKLCKAEGWEITVLDANGDTAKEAQNMETFVSQGMDIIFLDSVDPESCIPSINAATAAGIGVINLDSGVGEGANYITTVYSDNKQNGRAVGLAYAEKMGTTPIKAILLSGAKGNIAGDERRTGLFCGIIEKRAGISEADAWIAANKFDDELLANGKATNADANFTVVGQGWGGWTAEEGLTAAEDLITANPSITTVLGENDQMLFGAMTALTNANITGVDIVAAADGAKAAYDLIKKGTYFATGENSPYKISELGMKIAKEVLVDGKDPKGYAKVTMTAAAAVTKANVDQYYQYGF